ncbi:FecR domain-containing protein [Fulvivirgaceae bacterium BMA12]|uniref:FecR domain-containing protein n=1 Tax=Agaribacillus aureus TaxID=3051825 RepID=A0ABT8L441_9BACT|nr:FecR domain-containing protein [Fulvivirgaceae bacterium BMA12]
MTKKEFLDLLERYIQGTASDQDKRIFDEFYNNLQVEEQDHWSVWELTDKERTKIEIYESLNKLLEEEERNEKGNKGKFTIPVFKVVASIVIIIGLGATIYSTFFEPDKINYITKSTQKGQKATIMLSDGSSVRLNARSTIIFPETFSTDRRTITLIGEAFFEVQKDTSRPFVVKTGSLNTTVLGTSFNVKARESHKYIEVTVATGKVQVSVGSGNGEEIIYPNDQPESLSIQHKKNALLAVTLSPGEQALFVKHSGDITERSVSLDKYLAWNSDVIYLDNTPMNEVAEILGNWYDVDIKLENPALHNCLVSGKYKGDKLENILKSLRFMQGIEFKITGERQITLNGKPCK